MLQHSYRPIEITKKTGDAMGKTGDEKLEIPWEKGENIPRVRYLRIGRSSNLVLGASIYKLCRKGDQI